MNRRGAKQLRMAQPEDSRQLADSESLSKTEVVPISLNGHCQSREKDGIAQSSIDALYHAPVVRSVVKKSSSWDVLQRSEIKTFLIAA